MIRREFLKMGGAAAVQIAHGLGRPRSLLPCLSDVDAQSPQGIFVSTTGNDGNEGSVHSPFATLQRAQRAVRAWPKTKGDITIWIRGGTYYLEEPLIFNSQDSGRRDAVIRYSCYPKEAVTLSGGRRLRCNWTPYKGAVISTPVPEGVQFSQLFVNGKRQIRARYPNYGHLDKGQPDYLEPLGAVDHGLSAPNPGPNDDMAFSGAPTRGIRYDPSTLNPARWAKPEEAEIHIFQQAYWGNLQWKIRSIDTKQHIIWFGDGGQQIGAKWDRDPAKIGHKSKYFIENVFEELDAPGEWYLDTAKATLYYYPPSGMNLDTAVVEVPQIEDIIRFQGGQAEPVEWIAIQGLRFTHTLSTYMATYEVPSLSDWSIHRGGTVFFDGARDCSIKDCWFDSVGGNAVFINDYNRDVVVTGCKFTETGDSAICLVGDLQKTSGTQRAFPYECKAHNNLIFNCGVFGKQVAGVYISRAKRITVSHNLIHDMPRSAICIGDSTWGGHVIEFNHTHDTVLETSDHGPFNAWGRDRAWSLAQSHAPYTQSRSADAWDVLVDAMEPVVVRNNLFDERSGWGLDLDDGASNYKIYNNISVGGVSMKWREGAYREVYNNVWYKSRVAPCFHVGNDDNHDRYYNNITVMESNSTSWPSGWPWWPQMFYSVIAPPANGPWFEEVDRNCFYVKDGGFQAVVDQLRSEDGKRNARRYTLPEWQALGFDKHSIFADPQFIDPERNDFRVKEGSPALKLGFKNFPMGQWGLTEKFPRMWL